MENRWLHIICYRYGVIYGCHWWTLTPGRPHAAGAPCRLWPNLQYIYWRSAVLHAPLVTICLHSTTTCSALSGQDFRILGSWSKDLYELQGYSSVQMSVSCVHINLFGRLRWNDGVRSALRRSNVYYYQLKHLITCTPLEWSIYYMQIIIGSILVIDLGPDCLFDPTLLGSTLTPR